MANETAISWTDLSWNPVHGCSKVSPGCAHCYAETLSRRYKHTLLPWTPGNAAENVLLKPHKLREPLSSAKAWRGLGAAAAAAGKTEGKLVFVNSTSDLFHDEVPDEFIAEVFGTMVAAPKHTFQVLTKRPERMRELLGQYVGEGSFWPRVWEHAAALAPAGQAAPVRVETVFHPRGQRFFLDNTWLGVSIENRRYVDRADILRETPAAVRFISAEPLLGPLLPPDGASWFRRRTRPGLDEGQPTGHVEEYPEAIPALDLTDIDWLIVGGESGAGYRPMRAQWAEDLLEACGCDLCDDGVYRADRPDGRGGREPIPQPCCTCNGTGWTTAFLMKQMGGARPGDRLEDLPEDLRIRDFPQVAA
jgi:protein gp37